jgi:hypothetical protein
LQARLDGANQLELAAQISVSAHAIFQPMSRLGQPAIRRNGLICPTGTISAKVGAKISTMT